MNCVRLNTEKDGGQTAKVNEEDMEFYRLIISKVVSTIFEQYDNSQTQKGRLTKENAKLFIKDTLRDFQGEDPTQNFVDQLF